MYTHMYIYIFLNLSTYKNICTYIYIYIYMCTQSIYILCNIVQVHGSIFFLGCLYIDSELWGREGSDRTSLISSIYIRSLGVRSIHMPAALAFSHLSCQGLVLRPSCHWCTPSPEASWTTRQAGLGLRVLIQYCLWSPLAFLKLFALLLNKNQISVHSSKHSFGSTCRNYDYN